MSKAALRYAYVSKETYYRAKRDLSHERRDLLLYLAYLRYAEVSKRPRIPAKETYYRAKRDLLHDKRDLP